MASVSLDPRAWLRALCAALALLCWASVATAHPMPESLVWIDTTPDGMNLTAQLPLNRLEFAFGKTLTDRPRQILARYGDALSAYLLVHVGARSQGKGWQVLRPRLQVVGSAGAEELQATFVMRAPAGADARAPDLLYDVITHEVRTHRVQVFLRNDWRSGFVARTPLLLGELDHGHTALFVPLGQETMGASILSLFAGGVEHIAAGTDHLLFLLMLLLVAPLAAQGRRWCAARSPMQTVKHTLLVVTAFTIGHTLTLVLGSTGLVVAPEQAVEVAVALTIAVAAIHAWRPLFAHAEAAMALGFGLVHGMAFSRSLSGAGLTAWQHAQALLSFNLGIESMQLAALAIVLPPLLILSAGQPRWYARMRSLLAALAGAMACAWVAQRTGLVDLDQAAWLGDGGMVPAVLVGLLWVAALGYLLLGHLLRVKLARKAVKPGKSLQKRKHPLPPSKYIV